jgi:hypothetical protein
MAKLDKLPKAWSEAVSLAHHEILDHDSPEKFVVEATILAFINHLIESGMAKPAIGYKVAGEPEHWNAYHDDDPPGDGEFPVLLVRL